MEDGARPSASDAPDRRLALFALLGLVTALAFGVAKLELQRAHTPAWAAKPTNSYEGYVSIDRFSERAALMRDALRSADGADEALREFVRDDLHPTTLTVPLAVAAVGLVVPSIPIAFAIVSSLAGVLLALLSARLARELAPGRGSAAAWTAAGVLLFHCLTLRTTSQLVLDGFCAALFVGALLLSLRWSRARKLGTGLALVLVLTLGLFTKVSLLPALALPALTTLLASSSGARVRRALVDAALFGLPPLALAAAYLSWLTGVDAGGRDLEHLASTWTLSHDQLRHFGVEMALLFQALPLLAFVRRPPLERGAARATLAALALVLASTWAFGLPAIPRLYLPALALGAALVGARLADPAHASPAWPLLIGYALLNAAIAGLGLFRIAT